MIGHCRIKGGDTRFCDVLPLAIDACGDSIGHDNKGHNVSGNGHATASTKRVTAHYRPGVAQEIARRFGEVSPEWKASGGYVGLLLSGEQGFGTLDGPLRDGLDRSYDFCRRFTVGLEPVLRLDSRSKQT